MNTTISRYMALNEYDLSRYLSIAKMELVHRTDTVIDELEIVHKASNVSSDELKTLITPSIKKEQRGMDIIPLREFSEEQKEIILTFFGYTFAYATYLNNQIIITKRNQQASIEAKRLYEALTKQTVNHISFNLIKSDKPLRIQDKQTTHKILIAIKHILEEQIVLQTDKRIGKEKNYYRKTILLSLTPLMRYLKHETSFSNKSWEDIAKWILAFLKEKVVQKYPVLGLSGDSYFTLVDYERKNREIDYYMEKV